MDAVSVPEANVRIGRAPFLVAALIPPVVVLVLALGNRTLDSMPGFQPSFLAIVWVLDLLTAFLLFIQYSAGSSPRLLPLACAYLWSSAVIVVHSLVFPGLFAPTGLLHATPSAAPWLWAAWHTGFPLIIGLSLAPWPRRLAHQDQDREPAANDHRRRLTAIGLSCTVVIAAAAAVSALVTAGHSHLPVIIDNGDYSVLTRRFGGWIIGANVLVLGIGTIRFLRAGARGLEAWVFVAVVASCGDVVLTLLARERFTIGWYSARVLALLAALVVLTALIREITLLYRRVRNSANQLVQHNAELRRANALRDHLVAVVSHELRTPLTAMTGIGEILIECRDELSEAERDRLLVRSMALTKRLSMLTEDLLAVSTIGNGELHVSPMPLTVDEALHECAATFPTLDVQVDCPPGLRINADPMRLQQMLTNYVRNSIKYGAPPILLSAAPAGNEVELRVRDHGTGVPPDFVPHLFDRFARAEQARTGVFSGSGLGLSIVAMLATEHGGGFGYDGGPDGASFFIRLPTPPGDLPGAHTDTAPSPTTSVRTS
ncbi:MASE4 domain-containing protein [Actinoplanes sp. N902-109]|uniref:sensor histidine kinase n=1 Tax=Actinoplanes sp. (strain N902-109) TaxID=649831 RepID=UPI00039B85B2|nr:MASE4 domain-containing protein [Actinoplanes sp. N902-109]